MIDITLRQMLEAGVHFGHRTRYWNPKMAPFIYGERQKIHIINLEETLPLFKSALEFLGNLAANKGRILFVGTKHAARDIIKEEAIRCGMPYIDNRWLAGLLTNYKTIRQSIRRLKDLETLVEDKKATMSMTKKEVLNLVREKDKLSTCLSGVKNMGGLPDALFVIDVGNEKIAIQEATRLSIPVVGIVDTNMDPNGIDFAVPGNDDAIRAIRFYCKSLADTIINARGVLELAPEKKKEEAPKAEVKITKKVVARKDEEEASTTSDTKPAKEKSDAPKKAAAKSTTDKAAKPATTADNKKATKTTKTASKKSADTKTPNKENVEANQNELVSPIQQQEGDK